MAALDAIYVNSGFKQFGIAVDSYTAANYL